jgi:hypothetical protein
MTTYNSEASSLIKKDCHPERSDSRSCELRSRRTRHALSRCTLPALFCLGISATLHAQVRVTPNETSHRVDITIDGAPFTSYLWQTNQRKPVLFPLIAPDGTTVTRGYPFAPLPGERTDHPHHAGLWFNYGNANGFDFWNNSDAIKPADRAKYGTITHDKILSTKSGRNSGELATQSTWIAGDAAAGNTKPILSQTTRYVFSKLTIGDHAARAIDMIITLKAITPVTFNDDKEGLLGIRVAHFLESATEKGGTFTDANGVSTKVDSTSNAGASGVYRTSAGITGDAVWSTRGDWCVLTGQTAGNKTESIAILSHPANPGSPPFWHARGYGLFAVNPLGAHIFDPKAPLLNFTLAQGASATFKYRVLILSAPASDDAMNSAEKTFAAAYR